MDEFNFKSLESLANELKDGVLKLNSGDLKTDDIQYLLDSSRQLHERLAVLQYLAEKHILKNNTSPDVLNDETNKVKKNQINLIDVIVEEEAKTEKVDVIDQKNLKSINDIHSTSPQTSLADQFGQQPILDLTKEIGINEKYLITENLFSGDNNAYLESINELNDFENIDQAYNYLNKTLLKKYSWNLKSNHFKRLNILVQRRYHN